MQIIYQIMTAIGRYALYALVIFIIGAAIGLALYQAHLEALARAAGR
jgi:hypothetical protein